jgi:hypothetical protein
VAAVSGLVLLDPAADLVEGLVAQPDHVEGVEHPGRGGQLGAQRGGVAAERIQRGHRDPGPPVLLTIGGSDAPMFVKRRRVCWWAS